MLLQILVPYSTVAFELTYCAGKLPLPALHIAGVRCVSQIRQYLFCCCKAAVGGGAAGADRDQCQQQETAEGDRGQDSLHSIVGRRKYTGRRDGHSVPGHVQDAVRRHHQETEGTMRPLQLHRVSTTVAVTD